MSPSSRPGLDQANALVLAFGKRLGVPDAQLDADLDRAFGEAGLRYDPARQVLVGRAFVTRVDLRAMSDTEKANWAINYRALKDPAIGGMFDQAGGHFMFDENKEMLFLVRDFPLASTSARELRRDMEQLMNIAATWTMRWLLRVVRIAHGREPAPTTLVTPENDPR